MLIGEALVQFTSDAKGTIKAMQDVARTADEANKQTVKGMEKADAQVQETGLGFNKFAGAAKTALLAAGAALTAYSATAAQKTLEWAGSVKTLAREIGESTEQTSQLIASAKRFGLSAEEASSTFGLLSRKIAEAGSQTGELKLKQEELTLKIQKAQMEIKQTTEEMRKNGDKSGELSLKVKTLNNTIKQLNDEVKDSQDPFSKLGINIKDAEGKTQSFNKILFQIADKFKAMPDGIEKTALAMDLFGRSGKELIPFLNQGSEGITSLMEQADKLGLTLTADNLASIKNYTAAQKDLADKMQALQLQVGLKTLPVMADFQTKMNEFVTLVLNAPKPVADLATGIIAFGGPVAGAASQLVGFTDGLLGTINSMRTLSQESKIAAALLGALPLAIVISVALVGAAVILKQISEMNKAFDDLSQSEKEYNDITDKTLNKIAQLKKEGKTAEAAKLTKSMVSTNAAVNEAANNRANDPIGKFFGFAEGVRNFIGGMAVVGERGPELVDLPAGSDVFSHDQSRSMLERTLPKTSGGVTINQNNTIYRDTDLVEASRRAGFELRNNY